MQISFQELRTLMKSTGIPVYRDEAPVSQTGYPYIVYEYVNESQKRASSKIMKSLPLYQIAVITNGTEADYEPLKKVFNQARIAFDQFIGIPFDENDDTVTQFITNVRCVNEYVE